MEQFGSSLERLARAYEADPDKRRDLSQDIHFQLWRSFQRYDGRCSLRRWIYRIAHHVAASHVIRERRIFSTLASLEELEMLPDKAEAPSEADRSLNLDRLSALIQPLKPLDREVIVSYLEDVDAASIAEITGVRVPPPGATYVAPCAKGGADIQESGRPPGDHVVHSYRPGAPASRVDCTCLHAHSPNWTCPNWPEARSITVCATNYPFDSFGLLSSSQARQDIP